MAILALSFRQQTECKKHAHGMILGNFRGPTYTSQIFAMPEAQASSLEAILDAGNCNVNTATARAYDQALLVEAVPRELGMSGTSHGCHGHCVTLQQSR